MAAIPQNSNNNSINEEEDPPVLDPDDAAFFHRLLLMHENRSFDSGWTSDMDARTLTPHQDLELSDDGERSAKQPSNGASGHDIQLNIFEPSQPLRSQKSRVKWAETVRANSGPSPEFYRRVHRRPRATPAPPKPDRRKLILAFAGLVLAIGGCILAITRGS
ncbi:hypothetical protein BJ742DRAFT_800580 [Cladochytrium replicatum]|nr:hypothetical protein BJ742DRAFT_800580 [Cladochytrium replicatum]